MRGSLFWNEATNEVYNLPNLLLGKLILVSFHIASYSVANYDEYLTVARTVIPRLVCQVRRRPAGERHRAIALPRLSVAGSTMAKVDLSAFYYRDLVSRNRVL